MKVHLPALLAATVVLVAATRDANCQVEFASDGPVAKLVVGEPRFGRLLLVLDYRTIDCAGVGLEFLFRVPSVPALSTPQTMTLAHGYQDPWSEPVGCGSRPIFWNYEQDLGEYVDEEVELFAATQLFSGELDLSGFDSPLRLSDLMVTTQQHQLPIDCDYPGFVKTEKSNDPTTLSLLNSELTGLQFLQSKYMSVGSAYPTTPEVHPSWLTDSLYVSDDARMESYQSSFLAHARFGDSTLDGLPAWRALSALCGWFVVDHSWGFEETRRYATPDKGVMNPQYRVNMASRAVLTKGGTFFDNFWAVSRVAEAVASLDSESASQPHIHSLQGAEELTYVYNASPDPGAPLPAGEEPLDLRQFGGEPTRSAPIDALIFGAGSFPAIDSKRVFQSAFPLAEGQSRAPLLMEGVDIVDPSYMHVAIGSDNIVSSGAGAKVDVANAAGISFRVNLDEYPAEGGKQSLPSRQRRASAMEAFDGLRLHGDETINRITRLNYTSLLIWSQEHNSPTAGGYGPGRGGALRSFWPADVDVSGAPEIVRMTFPDSPEYSASVIAMDSVILGDGQAREEMGHGNGDLTLAGKGLGFPPRDVAPALNGNLLASDAAGLLYFDASENTIRVTSAVGGSPSNRVVWRQVAHSKSGASHLQHAAYVKPSVSVTSVSGTPSSLTVNCSLNGFHSTEAAPVAAYWRLVPYGADYRGGSAWFQDSSFLPTSYSSVPVSLSLTGKSDDGSDPFPGQVIEIAILRHVQHPETPTEYSYDVAVTSIRL